MTVMRMESEMEADDEILCCVRPQTNSTADQRIFDSFQPVVSIDSLQP